MLAIDLSGGPGFFYNPSDIYVRPDQKIGFTIEAAFLEVQVKFDSGSWQTVKLCNPSTCFGYFLVDHPWTAPGVHYMEMRWRGEDGNLVDPRTFTAFVVPEADRAFRDTAGNTLTLWEGGNGIIDKPFVVVEGFDPINENFPELYFRRGRVLFNA